LSAFFIERVMESSCANKDTHTHRGYEKAYRFVNERIVATTAIGDHYDTFDIFARTCQWADFRNDLNPLFKEKGLTNMCMDGLEACATFDNSSLKVVFCDPPFSPRQADEKYDKVGSANLYTNPRYMSDLGKEIYRILEPGGYTIKAGFNSNAPDPRLNLVGIWLSHYHGSRNDVIFTVWQKNDGNLFQY